MLITAGINSSDDRDQISYGCEATENVSFCGRNMVAICKDGQLGSEGSWLSELTGVEHVEDDIDLKTSTTI